MGGTDSQAFPGVARLIQSPDCRGAAAVDPPLTSTHIVSSSFPRITITIHLVCMLRLVIIY
jgi:hypothetical protein